MKVFFFSVNRSSVKLMSLGAGHGDLNVLISEVKDMRNTAKAFMNAQSAGETNVECSSGVRNIGKCVHRN